jgi:1-aminocyclopropane-1-carboxylate deaminase/D-cysteine desulfhydrase-like pyridoxal-dependent ACC family enzyme
MIGSPPGPGPLAPALFRHRPELAAAIPWIPLARVPTPVEPLEMDLPGEWWIKRDDHTGVAYGGNKVRKLEFLLADALRRGAGRLITAGATGSHHVLATSVYARTAGIPVTAVLFPQPFSAHARETLLDIHGQGASLVWAPQMGAVPILVRATAFTARSQRPYLVPPGGSDALGTLGYASAALELAEQTASGAVPVPREIWVAAGTMGTAVGLAVGLTLAGLPTRVVAVRITSALVTNRFTLRALVRRTLATLERGGVRVAEDGVLGRIELRHDQIGPGYGHRTPAGDRAAERLGATGVMLDATYTAKVVAGLVAAASDPGPRLFWHTLSAHAPGRPAGFDPETLHTRFRTWLRTETAPAAEGPRAGDD